MLLDTPLPDAEFDQLDEFLTNEHSPFGAMNIAMLDRDPAAASPGTRHA